MASVTCGDMSCSDFHMDPGRILSVLESGLNHSERTSPRLESQDSIGLDRESNLWWLDRLQYLGHSGATKALAYGT